MSDDLSPMLSQPSDDNAHGDLSPMISGRGTKIMVSARGAYLAGNVDALIEMLDEVETRRFNLGCLERLTDLAHEQMAVGGLSDREQRIFEAIYGYLREPTAERRDTLHTALASEAYVPFDPDDVQFRDYVIAMIGLSAMLKGTVHSAFPPILHHMLQITGRIPYRQRIRAQLALGQWKLDSAWAVLQGKAPEPYELSRDA